MQVSRNRPIGVSQLLHSLNRSTIFHGQMRSGLAFCSICGILSVIHSDYLRWMVLGNFILPHWKSLWIPYFQVSNFILQSTVFLRISFFCFEIWPQETLDNRSAKQTKRAWMRITIRTIDNGSAGIWMKPALLLLIWFPAQCCQRDRHQRTAAGWSPAHRRVSGGKRHRGSGFLHWAWRCMYYWPLSEWEYNSPHGPNGTYAEKIERYCQIYE